jgi:uncharacterized protein
MDITPRISAQSMVVQSYKGGQFKISGDVHQGNVLVFTERVIDWPVDKDVAALTIEDFAPIIAAKDEGAFDVLLMGTGADFQFLAPALKLSLQQKGIAPDMMNTGAACRTFNTLLADGRRVCAAMLTA